MPSGLFGSGAVLKKDMMICSELEVDDAQGLRIKSCTARERMKPDRYEGLVRE